MTDRLVAARLPCAASPITRAVAVPPRPDAAPPTTCRTTPVNRGPRRGMPTGTGLAVTALLALYAIMAWTAALGKGVSFDEGVQLAVGYNEWLYGDYRIEGANGDFVKRWATLPYLISRPKFLATSDPLWQRADSYAFGREFLFELGNAPGWLLAQSRAMIVLLGMGTGALIFHCARVLFGVAGGFVGLALFVFSPHMLAFGAIVSTDMSTVLTLFASTWCIWGLLHEVTVTRVLVSLACFAGLLLAKMTAAVIFPITVVLIAIRVIGNRPLVIGWRHAVHPLQSHRARAAVVGLLILGHGLAGGTALWAHYGFRYAATPAGFGLPTTLPPQTYADGRPGVSAGIVAIARQHHLLPEGYCRGVEWLLGSDDKLPAFMGGNAKLGGWREFFPYAIWVKTHPALFVLVAVGLWGWWRARRAPDGRAASTGPALYEAAPHVTLIAVYLAVAVTENINLGHRHVLPIYPALYVLAAAVVLLWRRHALA